MRSMILIFIFIIICLLVFFVLPDTGYIPQEDVSGSVLDALIEKPQMKL